MTARAALLACALASFCFGMGGNAHAEKADRDKPVAIEAERMTYDDLRQLNIFEGKVVLTQGTLMILADRITVKQDPEGFQVGTADKGPEGYAYFRQKREALDEYVQGWGDRIVYDAKTEKAEMIGRARFKRGLDEVRGNAISYDGRTEFYSVTGGGPGVATPNNPEGRVRAVIQPKSTSPAAAPAPGGDLRLRSAGGITAPRSEYPEPRKNP